MVYFLIFLLRNVLMECIKKYLRAHFNDFNFYLGIDSRIAYTKYFCNKVHLRKQTLQKVCNTPY